MSEETKEEVKTTVPTETPAITPVVAEEKKAEEVKVTEPKAE